MLPTAVPVRIGRRESSRRLPGRLPGGRPGQAEIVRSDDAGGRGRASIGGEASRVLLERWQTYWSSLFYGLLLVSTAVAVADAGSDGRRVAIVALAAGLAGCYQLVVSWGGGRRALSLAVAAALWGSLLALHWIFLLLLFSAYHLACSDPRPARRALPRIAAVSALVVVAESLRRGGVDPLQLVFYAAVTLALGLSVAMMQALHAQSEERRRLIAELQATRGELAESERRAGGAGPPPPAPAPDP